MPTHAPARAMHVHLVAICGTGMGSLASLLKRAGHHVTGSDASIYPPMSEQLASAGIVVSLGYDAGNLPPQTDLVVVGNAISRGHPEVEAARARGITCLAMADALRELFLDRRAPLVVAGTHGKTTTAFLLAHVLRHAGRDAGCFVGGVLQDGSGGARLGSGREFVVEGDEYDNVYWDKTPKFLHYAPAAAIVTAVELDHVDIYAGIADIEARFAELARLLPPDGHLLVGGCPRARRVVEGATCRVETYGSEGGDDWRPVGVTDDGESTSFVIVSPEGDIGPVRMSLAGGHNITNAIAAVALAVRRGVDPRAAGAALTSFPGVRRRQEVRGEADGVLVIDDFAHHPTAVAHTLHALHERHHRRGGRVWAIFEPRSATSCRNVHQFEYEACFDAATKVLFAPNARAAQIPEAERLDLSRLVAGLRGMDIDARAHSSPDEIVAHVTAEAAPGDIVVVLSNGGFGGMPGRLLEALAARRGHGARAAPAAG